MMQALSLAIVGAEYPNKRGPSRRFGIGLCRPGDPIELRREPRNPYDEFAIAAFGHDIQLGYVRSERAAWLAPQIDAGRSVSAVFQEATGYGCAVRLAFDGTRPELPPRRTNLTNDDPAVDPDPEFAPDPVWDD